jgi:hypothetical protein
MEQKYTVYCDDFPSQRLNGVAFDSLEGAYMVWGRLILDGHDAYLVREDEKTFTDLAWYVRDLELKQWAKHALAQAKAIKAVA